jgi:hypothetical protein
MAISLVNCPSYTLYMRFGHEQIGVFGLHRLRALGHVFRHHGLLKVVSQKKVRGELLFNLSTDN